jgi:hypothetical protein
LPVEDLMLVSLFYPPRTIQNHRDALKAEGIPQFRVVVVRSTIAGLHLFLRRVSERMIGGTFAAKFDRFGDVAGMQRCDIQ